jgi:hypothetical protein
MCSGMIAGWICAELAPKFSWCDINIYIYDDLSFTDDK